MQRKDTIYKMGVLAVIAVLATGSGCGVANSMARTMTSGQIGCAPDDIIIEDLKNGMVTNSWVAKCEGKTYYCSQTSDGPANCKEAKKPKK